MFVRGFSRVAIDFLHAERMMVNGFIIGRFRHCSSRGILTGLEGS